jgi:hypothetical protein
MGKAEEAASSRPRRTPRNGSRSDGAMRPTTIGERLLFAAGWAWLAACVLLRFRW